LRNKCDEKQRYQKQLNIVSIRDMRVDSHILAEIKQTIG